MPTRRQVAFDVPDQLRTADTLIRIRLRRALLGTPEGELWKQHLTPHQRSEALKTGWVPVRGSSSGQFCVNIDPIGMAAVTSKIRGRDDWRSWCLQVGGQLSPVDAALAKIMLIQADEGLFRKTAR